MSGHGHHELPHDPIDRALVRARGVLPDQGPIGVFIHHNTLHAFQHLPFHDGVQAGADALGARPYLSLDEFRGALQSGRIHDDDARVEIVQALGARANDLVLGSLTRAELWHVLMTSDADTDDVDGLVFSIAEGTARECTDMARWQACLARATRGPSCVLPDTRIVRRHRDVLVACGARDTDVIVHGELIRLSSGFLDQGQAHTVAPGRERGFLATILHYFTNGASAPRQCRGVDVAMRRVASEQQSARRIMEGALVELGIRGADVEPFVCANALALPGWTGMFSRLERHPEDQHDGPPVSMEEFLAVRLLYDVHAITQACAEFGLPTDWTTLRARMPARIARPAALDAALLWSLTAAANVSHAEIATLNDGQVTALWEAVADCTRVARRRVFQNAYERTYREMILDAVAARRALPADVEVERPRAQFVFCIDEREESIRRALEEQHPGYITFGMAGFFGVAIDYQGLYDREPAAYCPVVVTPGHEVHEQPVFTSLQ
ncbi:MAG: DUF2309 family protein, partial [Gemmatimonadaceae bacterium]|nr:DUF2309 family protein [Gemmatimonadaceae bacterium]